MYRQPRRRDFGKCKILFIWGFKNICLKGMSMSGWVEISVAWVNVNALVYFMFDCSNKDRWWRTINSPSDLSGTVVGSIYRRVWPTGYFRARNETDGRAVIDVAVHLAAVSDPGESCASYCGPVSTRLTALQHGRSPLILFTPHLHPLKV